MYIKLKHFLFCITHPLFMLASIKRRRNRIKQCQIRNEDPVCSADVDNCITVCVDCHQWIHTHVPGCGYGELRCSEK